MISISRPCTGNTTATVTLAGGPAKGGVNKELEEVVQQSGTPRSARRRAATPFNDGADAN